MAGGHLTATIILHDVDDVDSISIRSVVLSDPSWSVKIGRGTMSGDEGLRPAEDNAWFDSRVMSRNHAILRADPVTRLFTIEDTGSMHGTQSNGRRLKTKSPQMITNRDTLVFGADVTRGSSQFRALKVMVVPSWSDEEFPDPNVPLLPSFRNTFSADYSEDEMYDDAADQDHLDDEEPNTTTGVHDELKDDPAEEPSLPKSYGEHGDWADYSEDEPLDDQDDEVEIVKESIRAPSVEVIVPPRAVSVMVSEDSDQASSYFSEGEVDESPTSSPLGLNDDRADNIAHDTSTKPFHARVDLDQEDFADDVPESHTELEPKAHYASPDGLGDMRTHLDCQFVSASALASLYDTGSASVHKPLAQLHPSEAVRAPSPSEVAMVKPTSDVIIQQPFPQQLPAYRELPTYPLDMPGRDPVWDGSNWDFYDSAHPRFVASENSYVRDTEYVPFEAQYVVNPAPLDTQYASASTLPARLSNASPSVQALEAKPTPKCSIAQLLDESKHSDEHVRIVMGKSLKRKVDQISDSPEEMQSAKTHDLSILNNDLDSDPLVESSKMMQLPTECTAKITATSLTETTATSAAEQVSGAIEIPPRKKVKRGPNPNNDGGSFMKIAAATIAGVAIGTVGTIIGLASLPQDYFI